VPCGDEGDSGQESADRCAVIGNRDVHIGHGRYYSVHTAKGLGISLLIVA
jgi:hypothetical protein